MTQDHTVKHFREQLWQPMLLDRQNYHTWKENGARTMEQRIKEKIRDILANHDPKPLPENVRAKIRQIREKSEKERVKS